MSQGTISDFDRAGRFGVIETEDGRLILFDIQSISLELRAQFTIGTHVQFFESPGRPAPSAVALRLSNNRRYRRRMTVQPGSGA